MKRTKGKKQGIKQTKFRRTQILLHKFFGKRIDFSGGMANGLHGQTLHLPFDARKMECVLSQKTQ